ncbi:choice-of-anchor L domain-containing protein [Psychroserpens sp. BH13MA-6]
MKIVLFTFLMMTSFFGFSQMTIVGSTDPQVVIQNSLIGNPNFPATNFNLSSGNNFGSENGIGTFSYTGSLFPLEQGIVLATGDVDLIAGPNTSQVSTGSFDWLGDPQLDASFGTTSWNASLLEFDFVANVEMISLDFLLASEDYTGTFECTFSDAFAVYITNLSTGVTENIALVPGTNTPISITTVNGGVSEVCPPMNSQYFERYNYLVNFAPSIPAEQSPIDLNGQTQVFTLVGDLEIGSPYSIKIVAADAIDTALDSALFVRNDSFGAFPVMDQNPQDIAIVDLDDNGIEIFDLTQSEALMLGSIDTTMYSFLFQYHTSQSDAELGINPIANPQTYINTSALETIYVSMENAYTGTRITNSFRITINPDLLSLEDQQIHEITLYPNPINDQLFIESPQKRIKGIVVYNMNGQLLLSTSVNNEETISVDFSNWDHGMYLIELISDSGTVFKKVLK